MVVPRPVAKEPVVQRVHTPPRPESGADHPLAHQQAVLPAREDMPVAHGVHGVPSPSEYVPTGQMVHVVVLPPKDPDPTGHGKITWGISVVPL